MACNAGFKGAKSARDSWSRLYDKIISGDTAGGEPATPASPKKKGTPGKRKAGMFTSYFSFLLCCRHS
jgi:hypothetical protein